jgi:stage II sporulation protein D
MTDRTQSLLQRLSPLTALLTLIGCTVGLTNPAQAAAPIEIRVAIKREASQVPIGSSVNAVVFDSAGKAIGEIQGMNGFVATRDGNNVALDKWKSSAIVVQPREKDGVVWIGDRWYRGRVVITPNGSGITAVNWVDVEQYLYSVLGGEMSGSWHQEALKSQAVAARTYALHNQAKSRNGLYDVVDTTSSQVYRGIQDESTGTQMAVNSTKGQVLTYGGQLILAAFHSSSGGQTDNVEEVWVQKLPYLRSVPDFDQDAPVYRWNKPLSLAEANSMFACKGGNVTGFKAIQLSTGKRVKTMQVQTDRGTCNVDGEDMQGKLGLRSNKFAITPVAKVGKDGKPTNQLDRFEVVGSGFGHGLGLSQYGALGMAKRGYNYQQIVAHYYQNAQLSKAQRQ